MSGRYTFLNLTCYVIHVFISINLLSFVSTGYAFAKGNHYQLNEIAQLNSKLNNPSHWIDRITLPNNEQQFFIINKTGQIYLVDKGKEPKPKQVFNLSANNGTDDSEIKLTAIELHPNFALRDQSGYGTFYTAHLEILNKKVSTKRIQDDNNGLALKFDAVITEWQFYSSTYKAVDTKTKREIVRIAVPDKDIKISQMSFNPDTKSWDKGFSTLYIALTGDKKWRSPLYSGVLLRIDPTQFGLLNFTVPANNPYMKEAKIANEIYLLGGQGIKQFTWPVRGSDKILLSHRYNSKFLLSLTNINNDWRNKASNNILYQSEQPIDDMLLYKGRQLTNLRNTLLLLRNTKEGRKISSLNILPSLNKTVPSDKRELQQVWQFSTEQFTHNSEISFNQAVDGEVLIIDKTLGNVFQLSQDPLSINNEVSENKTVVVKSQKESISYIYIVIVILLLAAGVIYVVMRNKFSVKNIVQKQFSNIELSESQQQVGLYYRHDKNVGTIVNIADVAILEVMLNGIAVNIIDSTESNGFDDDKEQKLRDVFAKEKIAKMVNGKIRKINLLLTDTQHKKHDVCLYIRKGSSRITKKTYLMVVEDLIDWCWLIAEKINSNNTSVRKKKPIIAVMSVKNAVEEKVKQRSQHSSSQDNNSKDKSSLHQNSHENSFSINSLPTNNSVYSQQETESKLPIENTDNIKDEKYTEGTNNIEKNKTIDTQLVNSLERLAELKQQGFLTQEEFTKTKENLLKRLSD